MVEEGTVIEIRDEYPWASWAIWDDAFPEVGCVEETPEQLAGFIRDHSDQLTSDVILLGLNRSDDLPAPFSNFHAAPRRHYDFRLKEFIQDGGLDYLHGAYMTDLVDEIDPDSSTVTVEDSDARLLLDQLDTLDASEYHVICFGNKPFQGLVAYFDLDINARPHEMLYAQTHLDAMTVRLYRVWFYGLYGVYRDKVDILQEQLTHLDAEIGRSDDG